jgi:hypothetical protein
MSILSWLRDLFVYKERCLFCAKPLEDAGWDYIVYKTKEGSNTKKICQECGNIMDPDHD